MQLRVQPVRTNHFLQSHHSTGHSNPRTSLKRVPTKSPDETKSVSKDERQSDSRSQAPPSVKKKTRSPSSIDVVRQAVERPEESDVCIDLSSDRLAVVCSPGADVKTVAVTISRLSAHPYRGVGPYEVSIKQAGKELCTEYEARLIELEAVIKVYRRELAHGQFNKLSSDEQASRTQEADICLTEYKDTILRIILENLNSAGNPNGNHFTMELTTAIEVNQSLRVTPTELAISKTIFDHTQDGRQEPAMICHMTRKTLVNGYQLSSAAASRSSLYFELASQMCLRTDTRDLTHQGLIFDGFSASVLLLKVAKRSHLFSEHRVHLSEAEYIMPGHRSVFILDMVQLLSSYRDYRKVFTHNILTEFYNHASGEFELDDGDW